MTASKDLKIVVHGQSENPTRLDTRAGKFSLIIDEPQSAGGTDAGPSPVQVLLMALAGCINVTGQHIAKEMGLQLNSMKMSIEGTLNPATFYGTSFDERAGFKQIVVMVNPDFTNANEQDIETWLKKTEERCPVTDNLKFSTNIAVEVQKIE